VLQIPRKRNDGELAAGERFDVHATLVGPDAVAAGQDLAEAMRWVGESGLGRVDERGRFRLIHAEWVPYAHETNSDVRFAFLAHEPAPHAAALTFEAPLVQPGRPCPDGWAEWWAQRHPPAGPFEPFSVIMDAIAARVGGLAASAGADVPKPLPAVDAGIRVYAKGIQMESWALHLVRGASRKPSVATGWVGHLILTGDLAPWWPWLRAGQDLNVGDRAAMALGRYRLSPLTESSLLQALRDAIEIV
jgi:hypothetical protein